MKGNFVNLVMYFFFYGFDLFFGIKFFSFSKVKYKFFFEKMCVFECSDCVECFFVCGEFGKSKIM